MKWVCLFVLALTLSGCALDGVQVDAEACGGVIRASGRALMIGVEEGQRQREGQLGRLDQISRGHLEHGTPDLDAAVAGDQVATTARRLREAASPSDFEPSGCLTLPTRSPTAAAASRPSRG